MHSLYTLSFFQHPASYEDVGEYHFGLESSKAINRSQTKAKLNSGRECVIPNRRKKIMVREKIIEFVDGQYYKYAAYNWKNFPLGKMHNTIGVETNYKAQTVIYQITDYRLKPRFLTGIMKGKLRRGARETLMAYKHYIETG